MKLTRGRRILWALAYGDPRSWIARWEVAAAIPVAVGLVTVGMWVLWQLGEL